MAEQDSKPTSEEPQPMPPDVMPPEAMPEESQPSPALSSRRLLPLGLGLVALLVGCFWWGSQPAESTQQEAIATPVLTKTIENARSAQSIAALTRIASSLAEAQEPTATATTGTITVTVDSALIPLPTVTPTIVPAPVATRTIETSGSATLRLRLNTEAFETNGEPITIDLEPRSYVLGGDTMMQSDTWCVQLGPTGLVFDLIFTLQPVSENLHIGGELQLYDGFCGTLGNLGNRLSAVPMNVTVPAGSTAQLAPSLQVQGSLLGLPNLLDISTGVALQLSIRNPNAR
jgi:hypothetical protein